jgi:hypothetical protein
MLMVIVSEVLDLAARGIKAFLQREIHALVPKENSSEDGSRPGL